MLISICTMPLNHNNPYLRYPLIKLINPNYINYINP